MTDREKSIVIVSVFTAKGDMIELEKSVKLALEKGVTVDEIKESMIQLYAYCGFPRSLNALGILFNIVNESKKSGKILKIGRESTPVPKDRNSLIYGTKIQTEIVGAEVKGGIYEFAPMIDIYLKSHLFGDIFGQDVLDYKTREFITIGALASMEGVNPQLKAHIQIGKNTGITDEELIELVEVLRENIGDERAENMRKLLK